jgi:hypothetical protein
MDETRVFIYLMILHFPFRSIGLVGDGGVSPGHVDVLNDHVDVRIAAKHPTDLKTATNNIVLKLNLVNTQKKGLKGEKKKRSNERNLKMAPFCRGLQTSCSVAFSLTQGSRTRLRTFSDLTLVSPTSFATI